MAEDYTREIIPGRECGDCSVCCIALTIDDPELQKAQGFRCKNIAKTGGCAIYDVRPQTCRNFYCGWRQLKWVKQTLRPDLSGVLIRFQVDVDRGSGGQQQLGIVVTLLNDASVRAEGLAETVAAAVAKNIPVHLVIPGLPGQTAAMARINDALEEAVLFKDKAQILRILRKLRAAGKGGPRVTITFDKKGKGRSGAPDRPEAEGLA